MWEWKLPHVAYRELKHIEAELLTKMHAFSTKSKGMTISSKLSTKQFFGLDNNQFAVELAKVTLMLAKELALEESRNSRRRSSGTDVVRAGEDTPAR